MKPILFHVGGLDITSYGVSKALAALVAAVMLGHEFKRRGRDPGDAYRIVLWATVAGFAGAKLYYLGEHAGNLSSQDIGGYGFTWFGGFIGGAMAALWQGRRLGIPAASLAGMAAAPLAVAYGVGRLGCLLAGDGTYGKASTLPWAMAFPHGTVPTPPGVRVHPTPLYEAIVAFAIGAALWRLRDRLTPHALFGLYAILTGTARFLVEFLRINDRVLFGLSAPQLWSLALIVGGVLIAYRAARSGPGLVARASARLA